MSVINQMLRDLDARGRASADAPVAPSPPIGVKRQPIRLALGGVGLAAGLAAIYWLLPAIPTTTAPEAPRLVA